MGSTTTTVTLTPSAGIPRAILDAPDAPPRLVFADARQERTDPRGELISIQCALAAHRVDGARIHREWVSDDLADDDARALASASSTRLVPPIRSRAAHSFAARGSRQQRKPVW